MAREIISINVGQCGLQLGHSVWEQYCAEHNIGTNGRKQKDKEQDSNFLAFYEETDLGHYNARNLMVDLVPDIIDDVKQSKYCIFEHEFLLAGKEDAGNNFCRGHYTVGKEMIDKVNDKLRKLVERCGHLQGFMMNHSVGGGTGSGLGALILERIAVDYRKKSKIGFEVFSDPNHNDCVSYPYNEVLSTHWLLDHTEVSVIYCNEKIYEICRRNLKIEEPSHHDMNRLIAKNISSITAALRFEHIVKDLKGNNVQFNLDCYQTDLVPFPRLHFMLSSMSPITPKCEHYPSVYKSIDESPLVQQLNVASIINEEIAQYTVPLVTTQNVVQITEQCFDQSNFFVSINDFDPEEDKFMAVSSIYRGDVEEDAAYCCVGAMKTNKRMTMVEWCPGAFGYRVHKKNYAVFEDDAIYESERSMVMLGNNSAIARFFSERVAKKFDLNYSQNAYLHWYVGEGCESGEFPEAREDLGFLEKDYLDVLSEQATDESYDDSDY